MPGTIQVSVIDLLDLPSSSMSIKVSMGKSEHQIWGKEVFSFPLTTLHDNLIVTLYDIEGNELSRTGVKTKLVVEKGFWDDFFPLEGGGRLHMKLQFILSEEDRKRIREMRESARKKKQDELLINSERRPESAALARVDHNIVSDSRESIVEREASVVGRSLHGRPVSSTVSHGNYPDSGPENREEVWLEHTSPNKTDGRERTPEEAESSQEPQVLRLTDSPSQEHQVLPTEDNKQQTDTQSPPDGIPARLISSEGTFGYSKIPSNNEADKIEVTSSAPIPLQEHKGLHLTEATQKIPGKINTESPPNDNTTMRNSSENQTLSTSKQIALEKTPENVKIDAQSPANAITTDFNSSQDWARSTTKKIALVETPRDIETDREGTSSKTTQDIAVEINTQSSPNDNTTMSHSSQNQTHSTINQMTLDKTSRNNETDSGGTQSVARLSQELKVFQHTKTTQQAMQKTDIQSPPNVVPTRFASSKETLGSSMLLLSGKGYSAPSPLEENQTHSTDNQTTMKKTPSNVRKIISALESSLPQGPLPHANAPKLKPHLSKVTAVSLKGPVINEAKMENTLTKKQIIGRELNPFSVRKPLEVNVEQNIPHSNEIKTDVSLKVSGRNEAKMEILETEKQTIEDLNHISVMKPLDVNVQQDVEFVRSQELCNIDVQTVSVSDRLPIFQNSRQLEVLDAGRAAVEGNYTSEQVDCNIQHKKEIVNKQEILSEEFAVKSETDTATISGRIIDNPTSKEHTHGTQQTAKASDRLPISQSSSQLELLDARPAAVEGNISSEQVDCNIQLKNENINVQETLLEEYAVISEEVATTFSGRVLHDSVSKEDTVIVHHEQGPSHSVSKESGWKTYGDDSEKISTCGTSFVNCKSQEHLGVEQSHNEVGSWILPDEGRSLCITTGSKQLMEFMGCSDTFGENNRREISLSKKGVENEVALNSDTFVKVNEIELTSQRLRKPKLERSKDDRISGGLVGQAIRIVILVAFGTLVIVFRTTNRYKSHPIW